MCEFWSVVMMCDFKKMISVFCIVFFSLLIVSNVKAASCGANIIDPEQSCDSEGVFGDPDLNTIISQSKAGNDSCNSYTYRPNPLMIPANARREDSETIPRHSSSKITWFTSTRSSSPGISTVMPRSTSFRL